jgi:alpha-tubulin suppressor-like RCC1 family protein
VISDGTVSCFGGNQYGQLGNTTNIGNDNANPVPTQVAGLTHATQAAAGLGHTCVLKDDGTVACWGLNNVGQLGNATNNGTGNANPAPRVILGLTHVTQIASGRAHTCALRDDGTVSCWGLNSSGQLGTGINSGNGSANPAPVAVAGLTHVTQIAAGSGHTCAVVDDGTVACWGDNQYGELGSTANNGTTNANPTPTVIAGLTGVTQVAAGSGHTCAVIDDGTVRCWGDNRFGQSGNAANTGIDTAAPIPTVVVGLAHATRIAAGFDHTCALAGGVVSCWGDNDHGQLGNVANSGTTNATTAPVAVTGLSHVTRLGPGYYHTCGVVDDGTSTCWGGNHYGQLGNTTNNGTPAPNPSATTVADLP